MTIEQLQKIAWLNRAFYNEKKVKALESLCKCDRERTQRITANYEMNDKGKSDSRKNGTEMALIALAISGEQYDKALREYSDARKEISKAIEDLRDSELEAIFTYRYLENKTIDEIAECMRYDTSTILRKHKKGLDKLPPDAIECHLTK